ncbi:phosphoribosylglycinamide formyltransferase [Aquicella lusitana]|uniref:Phosphoribosylglycinamide formyltransferase n=1 Tax=Aquicella lusitana TaxID=254246 RepID=A0A370GRT4_9COXI|nr:phosphoribosylglycinamide formyltransferase [Aquicella lusitana]RDI45194.1 formyltetrahydrofolate-dependent phosphoribosylglycinamide formyltransferase [Aquicella lusitana]VVC72736.1 Phosphoribosylglycinamide formyltransferase [Aquicella lusitana]
MIRLGILGSTRGTNMLAIIDAIQQRDLTATIEIVISNKADAVILERAATYGLPARFIDPKGLTREAYDAKLSAVLRQCSVDLVVLTGFMRILSADFIAEWKHKIINVHPSLLPAFAGKMDMEVHRAVVESGVSETGCTVHYVTEEVDAGPVILQKKCPVLAGDTPESVKARVQQLESRALVEAIRLL